MDIDCVSFYPLVLDILDDISEAHFVAIDLELSGVPSKDGYASRPGKPSLQQRYVETKEAAERYQILQVGLTCVFQDLDDGKYTLKPYNFHLSPIIQERGLDIERIFSFQSGAVDFLLRTGFDLNTSFVRGVPYLSRVESRAARQQHVRRQDKSLMADIQIKPTETETLAFLERVRGEIRAWLTSRRKDPLEIRPVGAAALGEDELPEELSRFEKRLVHQLVRAEFPELVSIGRRGSIRIEHFNKEREEWLASQRERELEERINRQKGFRWLIEALCGGGVAGIDFNEVAKDSRTGAAVFADLDQYKAQLHRAQVRIKGNPRVLVGHNCFLDLVYIYRAFIGELPDTVEAFQSCLHQLWPVVIDTKYMSTHNCGDISPVSSLEQIAHQLRSERVPTLETMEHHRKYDTVPALHEAGYDSFLTAQVAVKLSAKLERESAYMKTLAPVPNGDVVPGALSRLGLGSNGTTASMSNPADEPGSSKSPADALGETSGFTPSIAGAHWKRTGDPSLGPVPVENVTPQAARERKRRYQNPKAYMTFDGGMPRFGSDFWRVYGNKLRVFGTEEGMCVLDAHSSSPDSEDGGVGV